MKCPFCGQNLPLHVALDSSIYKDKPQQAKPLLEVKDVETQLGKDLADQCDITIHDNNTIHIKPRKYLGKTNFYKLVKQVRDLKGEYVSNGKNSYLWIPRQQPS